MAKGLVTDTYLSNIADAIRTKNGTETQYKPSEMAAAITNLSTKARPNYVSFCQYSGTSLDISWLDVSNITSMNNMFQNCSSLTTLDVSSWDTGNITNMNSMFSGCKNLTVLDLSNFTTSETTSFMASSMFSNCRKLTEVDISNMDLTRIATINYMFENCGSDNETPTIVYVKDEASQQKVLSATGTPASWSTANVIIKEATT